MSEEEVREAVQKIVAPLAEEVAELEREVAALRRSQREPFTDPAEARAALVAVAMSDLDWETIAEHVDTDVYVNQYLPAGGTLSFEDWRARPCCSCSKRHRGPEDIRPVGETEAERERKCLDQLAEWARETGYWKPDNVIDIESYRGQWPEDAA